jgi:hypothetical protein
MALSKAQQSVADDDKRFRVLISGRRFGKTTLAIRELCRHAAKPRQTVWYVAPSYRMAKGIVWRKLKYKLQDLRWVQKINESELTIYLKNGSEISLKGAENGDSLRGRALNFLVMDEVADIDPEVFWEILRPTLSDTQGTALFCGTPKGIGNWSFDLYQMTLENPQAWSSFQYTTLDGGFVSESELEAAKQDLDAATFSQEYMATFQSATNRVYYSFDRAHNVKKYEGPQPDVIFTGWDFNIDPMSVTIAVRIGDGLHVIDEIRMYSSNTQEAVEELLSRYPKAKIWAYPDPAGRARSTKSGGASDFIHLQNAGFIVKAPHSHDPIRDRVNAVNARLCNAAGQRNLFVDPKCKFLIECLERQTYQEGSTQPDKTQGYDHQNDSLGYMVSYIWPVKKDHSKVQQPKGWGHSLA